LTQDERTACLDLSNRHEAGTFFLAGLIDDVRIYSRVLSADEIEALAQ
jgi:hypothetical protein